MSDTEARAAGVDRWRDIEARAVDRTTAQLALAVDVMTKAGLTSNDELQVAIAHILAINEAALRAHGSSST